jgi:hypothetical protein
VNTDSERIDAGRGLLLRGDGRGRLESVPAEESGIRIYGEQRGCAISDFDADGRVDLAVTQNGSRTKLYRNTAAKPGLRVRLAGPPENPSAIGAAIRLKFGERAGPIREIRAGGGYWSQDSSVQVLSAPEKPTHIWVRWPGGKITITPVSQMTGEVVIDQNGAIQPPSTSAPKVSP